MTDFAAIAQAHGTPTYVYDAAAIRAAYRAFASAFPGALIAYAVKSNTALAVMRLLAREGAGADIVSGGELEACVRAGIAPGAIVFSGVGKTDAEITAALAAGVLQLNIESGAELARIAEIARGMGLRAPVALRLTPDVGGAAFDQTTTGRRGDKFGLLEEDLVPLYAQAHRHPDLDLRGLSVHIGSQILSLEPFAAAFARLAEVVQRLRAQGLPVRALDLGGGLGIPYEDVHAPPSVRDYEALVRRAIGPLDTEIILEPGRALVGAAGVILARVVRVKEGASGRFVVLDAGMNTLVRPALYGARHRVEPLAPRPGPLEPCAVVGPICESSDVLARDLPLPPVEAGDLILIRDAGAHGACLASTYNAHPLPAEVLVDGDKASLIRARQTVPDLFARDRVPAWLA
ncbi:MAG TPA: diaminopimelate decarboxylase [Rhodospirillaceae bacterium]|jgi:diaminopimelate decarboxylase|nr:diaminopimelate decarboxylase [Alphaproteobacteria bacterium]HBH26432.1 diaminopimelate decarboxylase [Rhodospirillaceae bacterium]